MFPQCESGAIFFQALKNGIEKGNCSGPQDTIFADIYIICKGMDKWIHNEFNYIFFSFMI